MKRSGKFFLKDAIKGYREDQDKIFSPKETIKKFKPRMISSGLNILNNTVRIDNGRLDIPVFFSICGSDAYKIIGTKKQMGKGATKDQAEASAIMELAERYSFFSFYKNLNNFKIATYDSLDCSNVVSFDLLAKSVNDNSDENKNAKKIFESLPLKWTKGYDLTNNREIHIPLDWFYAINAFNGPSSGNCAEEAICQGICEVVERHVSALISKNKIVTPIIDQSSVHDKLAVKMIKKYISLGIKLYITDFSFGTGIPSVGVLAYDPNTFPVLSEIVWTAGTAPDPEKALSRALTEVAQLAGDFNTGSNYVASGLPKLSSIDEIKSVIDHDSNVKIADLPNIYNLNIKLEIENCISKIKDMNMNTLVIDITHPLMNIPAFYTIIPGADFRERAMESSVTLFLAKIISENFSTIEAIKRLKEMNKLGPGKYFLYFYIGKCFLNMKKYEKAIGYFYKSLDLKPNKQDIPSIYSYLGMCFKNLGKYYKAIDFLNKSKMFDNNRTDIYNLKGYCYYMLGEYKLAIINFEKVIKLNPNSAIDYANIASSLQKMGKKKEAIYYYSIALDIDSSIDFAFKNLNNLLKS